jgi:hypothetical protein
MWWTGSVKDLVQMSNERLQRAIADATELPVFFFVILCPPPPSVDSLFSMFLCVSVQGGGWTR